MNIEDAAGALLILLPIAFNAFFFLLARRLPGHPARSDCEHPEPVPGGDVRLKLVWY